MNIKTNLKAGNNNKSMQSLNDCINMTTVPDCASCCKHYFDGIKQPEPYDGFCLNACKDSVNRPK